MYFPDLKINNIISNIKLLFKFYNSSIISLLYILEAVITFRCQTLLKKPSVYGDQD